MAKIRFLFNTICIIAALLVGLPRAGAVSASPAQQQSEGEQSAELSLASWGYEDVSLAGPYSSASYSIGLPYHWTIQPGGRFNLVVNYAASGITGQSQQGSEVVNNQVAATITIDLNERTIYQAYLAGYGEQTISVPLPAAWPKRTEDYDRLDVTFRVHGPCEYTTYSTLAISKTSILSLKYRTGQVPFDLSTYPVPFYQRTFLPNSVDFVLPENPTQLQSAAAVAVASGLGRLSNNRVEINTLADKENQTPLLENLIVIGSPAQNPLVRQLNELSGLPVTLQRRRLGLAISGPGSLAPAEPVTYTFEVKNTEAQPVTGLAVSGLLPLQAHSVSCQPECKVEPGLVSWAPGALDTSAVAMYSVTFTLPEAYPSRSVYLTAQLAQDEQPLNVSTLTAAVRPAVDPAPYQVTTQPASDYLFIYDHQAVPETDGIIQLVPSPWQAGKALLLVTGLTDDAVNKAGSALGSSDRFPGMSGDAVLVEEILPSTAVDREQSVDFSLADLGYKDQIVTGIGHSEVYYNFDLPLNWTLTEEASVRFLFSHSPLLDPQKSSLTLLFNNNPIASTALDETNAVAGELIGKLSASSARPGTQNTLLVQIEEDVTDRCIVPETTAAWTSLSAASTLHLAHSLGDGKNIFRLDYWPQQYLTDPALSNVLIALPEQPAPLELALALRTAAFLGASSTGAHLQPFVIMGSPGDMDLSGYQIVTIGRPTRSPLLQLANDALPQPFIPGTDRILQKLNNTVFRLPDTIDLGYLQLVPSPWNAERVLLAVTGTSDQGMLNAGPFLYSSSLVWQLEGNLALVRGEKLYTTDTNRLTKAGVAGIVATVVPEISAGLSPTALPDQAAGPVSSPTLVAGTGANGEASLSDTSMPTYAQRFPLLLPFVAGSGILIITAVVAFALRKRKNNA